MSKNDKKNYEAQSGRVSKIKLNAGDTFHHLAPDTIIVLKPGKGKGKDSAPDFPKTIQICKCSKSELTCEREGDKLQCVEECTEWDCKTYKMQK